VFLYAFAYILVTFGVFNLVLAIFVENTLNYAHYMHDYRIVKRRGQAQQKAEALQLLLCCIFSGAGVAKQVSFEQPSSSWMETIKTAIFGKLPIRATQLDAQSLENLNLRRTQAEFEVALEMEEVKQLLQDLDISVCTCERLFEILDADGNGYLTLNEFADGLMKLRGVSDKGDVVSCMLMLRSMQHHMTRFEAAVMKNQRGLKMFLESRLGKKSGLPEDPSPHN
jgi:hypothetical protein